MRGAFSTSLLYVLADALRSIRANVLTSVLTAVTIAFSLALLAFFYFLFASLNASLAGWGDRSLIVAYVKDAHAQDPQRLSGSISAIPGVKSVEFISKEKALKELKDELKGHERVFEGVDPAILPASFEIRLEASHRAPERVLAVVSALKGLDWTEDVQYSREWVEKFSAFMRFVQLAALIVGAFLLAATVFVISNTIRLTVYARRDEIEIMRLVGASDAYLKTPFFLEGVLQGAFGGALALGVLSLLRYMLLSRLPAYLDLASTAPVPLAATLAVLVASGVALGAAGTIVSMAKFMKA